MKFDEHDLKTVFARAEAAVIQAREALQSPADDAADAVEKILTGLSVLINIEQRWGLYDSSGKPSLVSVLPHFRTADEAVAVLDRVVDGYAGMMRARVKMHPEDDMKIVRHLADVRTVEQALAAHLCPAPL
jgi:hypothetical protein